MRRRETNEGSAAGNNKLTRIMIYLESLGFSLGPLVVGLVDCEGSTAGRVSVVDFGRDNRLVEVVSQRARSKIRKDRRSPGVCSFGWRSGPGVPLT